MSKNYRKGNLIFFTNPTNPLFFFSSRQISHVLTTLQVNIRGTQACINAASTVSGIIADLVRIDCFD